MNNSPEGSAGIGELTRRGLLCGSIRMAGLSLAAWTTGLAIAVPTSSAQAQAEVEALSAMLEAELLVAFAYGRILRSGVLSVFSTPVATTLLAHERTHVALLRGWVDKLGGVQPPPITGVGEADAALTADHVSRRLSEMASESDALRLLIAVERVSVGAYYHGFSTLAEPTLVRRAAEMLASDAQHATVLSGLLHPGDVAKAVPDAFVQGAR